MPGSQELEQARDAFVLHSWAESYRRFEAADRETVLAPEDLERLATAAYLIGRDAESETYRARAHQAFLDRGLTEAAARSAVSMGFGLLQRGAIAPASGWFARAARILDERQLDCVVRGYLLIPAAIQSVVQGDPAAGDVTFTRAAAIAQRFADRDLASLACSGRGRALIRLGNLTEGVARLDEAMVAVIAGEVTPVIAGDIYCSVLEACQETFDVRRASEWTLSLETWCDAQPGLVRYRGPCLLYRAEIMQMHGKWNDAAQGARDASELLASRPAAGAAFYRLAEIHRLRREFAKAEEAYTRANDHGRRPQPGLSLLRLAQGALDTAAASIRAALIDTRGCTARAGLLAAAVDILLAAGDLAQARTAAAELAEIASTFNAPLLLAASARATGAVRLAEGEVADAAKSLRTALDLWRDLEAPYEEAQTGLLLAAVCERRGDEDGRRLELNAARKLFDQLGVEASLARVADQFDHPTDQPASSLSEREAQVLRLVAAGTTNREIAKALCISEKTVARHVSNIFDKLGVANRTGATAWAYEHNLI